MSNDKKPVIGLTTHASYMPVAFSSHQKVVFLGYFFVDLVREMGGLPLLIPNAMDPNEASQIINKIDGLFLIGGQDIDPKSYNQQNEICYSDNVKSAGIPYHRPDMFAPDYARDRLEISLYKEAKKRKLPILGVCRGMQIINVAEGGSLLQELDEKSGVQHYLSSDGFIPYHNVKVLEGTLIYTLFEEKEYFTSSIHHQAIDKLGGNLVASGKAEDDIIEFIEYFDQSLFVIGIQGHPEKTRKNLKKYDLIFRNFIDVCKENIIL